MTGAGGAAAFTGIPGTGAAPVTDRPDLVSVAVSASQIGVEQEATFCFDEALSDGSVANGFSIKTYDASRELPGTQAVPDESNPNCVVVDFPTTIDISKQGSIGEVAPGSVTNRSSQPNYVSNAPLGGSTLAPRAGQTTGPDLLSATADLNDDVVTYTFDQQVEVVDSSLFQIVDAAGVETGPGANAPATVDPATLTQVRVTYPANAPIENATRYAVNRGAVQSGAQTLVGGKPGPGEPTTGNTFNPPGAVAAGSTTSVELESVEPRVDSTAGFVLNYSDDLDNVDPAGIIAILDNGEIEAAQTVRGISNSTRSRLLLWPDEGKVDSEPSAVVAIVSDSGAATPQNGGSGPITIVATPGQPAPMVPGLTNGPDLILTNIDDTVDQARFTYDEVINGESATTASDFRLLIPNGNPIQGNGAVTPTSDGIGVNVNYSGNISSAVGVGNIETAVADEEGNDSPTASISTTLIPLPPVGTPNPPVLTPPPTVGPITQPPDNDDDNGGSKKRRKGKIRGIKSPGRRVKGKVAVAGKVCDRGRRVIVTKKGKKKSLGADRTNRRGNFNIRTRKHKKGKLVVKVRRKSTANTICRPLKKTVRGRN